MLAGMRRPDATSLLADSACEEDGVARLLTCARHAEDLGSGRPRYLPARLRNVELRLAGKRAIEFFPPPPPGLSRT